MIHADTIRAFGDELLQIIKHATAVNREAKTAGALGKLTSGKIRPMPLPRVNLPVPKVV